MKKRTEKPEECRALVPAESRAREEVCVTHRDFYQRLRVRMRAWSATRKGRSSRWAEYLMLAPDVFHLVCKLAIDPEVAAQHRMKLAAVALYYIAPLDFMAEVLLGPIGFLDDLALAAFVLNGMLRDTPEVVIQRHWAGDGDILEWLRRLVQSTDDMLGRRMAGRMRKLVKSL